MSLDFLGLKVTFHLSAQLEIGKVVHSCFGKEAHDNYKEQINAFEKCSFDIYMEFDVNFSTKAHILIEHVPQVIQRTGKGLFFQSEEVVEATHSKFDIFWQRFKVIEVESQKHGERLMECVVETCTWHKGDVNRRIFCDKR